MSIFSHHNIHASTMSTKKTRVLNEMLEMNEIVNTCLEFVVPINLPAMMCVSVRQQ